MNPSHAQLGGGNNTIPSLILAWKPTSSKETQQQPAHHPPEAGGNNVQDLDPHGSSDRVLMLQNMLQGS